MYLLLCTAVLYLLLPCFTSNFTFHFLINIKISLGQKWFQESSFCDFALLPNVSSFHLIGNIFFNGGGGVCVFLYVHKCASTYLTCVTAILFPKVCTCT